MVIWLSIDIRLLKMLFYKIWACIYLIICKICAAKFTWGVRIVVHHLQPTNDKQFGVEFRKHFTKWLERFYQGIGIVIVDNKPAKKYFYFAVDFKTLADLLALFVVNGPQDSPALYSRIKWTSSLFTSPPTTETNFII
jgi:hypothetical protein